jgi:hypothetical protein
MNWDTVKKAKEASDNPIVTIDKNNRFNFNKVFSNLAQIDACSFLEILFFDKDRRIGFKFKKANDNKDDFRILGSSSQGYYVQSVEISKKDWVKSVIKNNKNCKLEVNRDGKIWYITLMPSFEYKVLRNCINEINPLISGIYRYINKSEIIYIGKGNIRTRFNDSQRENWDFELIEYSIIENDEDSLKWEAYWINLYLSEHERLPLYNRIKGRS